MQIYFQYYTFSSKMLIKELKNLKAIGIVNRETFNTVPITVEYSLTDDGLTLKPVLDQMKEWASDFRKKLEKKRKKLERCFKGIII
ncbi:helix-turn-helix domain-containing protein [Flavivirga sp. 57AJ16]|uniref:winged helix-turn-helix transcriptional regulator n=1 Tax=Flavivirga sp. 57AJ16 TaxID=3025307 RepID=UPI0023663E3D|nr:winged helix-turn-helix transcriptional regulator [Flavivirga sp. 57AJ16]MDD7886761.1 winged helix-turn-helix transcriptional regulator [Flavivirga sp. 57AJ16]